MLGRSRLIQLLCFGLAVGLFITAGLLLAPIEQQSSDSQLVTAENRAAMERSPELAILTTIPGGLRIMFVNYLWIRSQEAHQAGRHYDAYQLSELICNLQPYQTGVWAFQAWNMAWNISVTTKTKDERWGWVYNGIKLLRDRGIVLNPRSIVLFKELSWVFFSKVGGRMDDMHKSYKERWAGMMQNLLGAPPFDGELNRTLGQETQIVIGAFKPIADAPLDRSLGRQGREPIQKDQLAILMQDSGIRKYVELFAARGVDVTDTRKDSNNDLADNAFLKAYNDYSLDYPAQAVRLLPVKRDDKNAGVFDLINSREYTQERGKLLAFVRAQLLWNTYRMDPQYMYELMVKYDVPFDWRHAMPSALYWASYGEYICNPPDPRGMNVLNNSRNVLNSMKNLIATGLVNLVSSHQNPNYPQYYETADLRYIDPTHKQHLRYIEALVERDKRLASEGKLHGKPKTFADNLLGAGHVNFLTESIRMLYADGRIKEAQKYYDFIKTDYKRTGEQWDFVSVEDFVLEDLRRRLEQGNLRYVVVLEMLQYIFKRAYIARGLRADQRTYGNQFRLAKRIYGDYQKGAVERNKLPKFEALAPIPLQMLLSNSRQLGLSLSLSQKSDIYLSMQDKPEILRPVYLSLVYGGYIPKQCREENIDFNKAFPKPVGFDAYAKEVIEKSRRLHMGKNKTGE